MMCSVPARCNMFASNLFGYTHFLYVNNTVGTRENGLYAVLVVFIDMEDRTFIHMTGGTQS